MAERLARKGVPSDRIAIVRNWVDLDLIKPLEGVSPYRQELGIAETDRVILYSGNIGAKQGFDILIDAARRLSRRADIKFLIAGEGPAKSGLAARAANLPNVRFLPFQPYARLSEFLGVADIHVLPQAADAADLVLPSKLGGMLASGRRVIVTAAPGTELATFVARRRHRRPAGRRAGVGRSDRAGRGRRRRRRGLRAPPATRRAVVQARRPEEFRSARRSLDADLARAGRGDRRRAGSAGRAPAQARPSRLLETR